jgi:hypothetical protein
VLGFSSVCRHGRKGGGDTINELFLTRRVGGVGRLDAESHALANAWVSAVCRAVARTLADARVSAVSGAVSSTLADARVSAVSGAVSGTLADARVFSVCVI